MALRNQEIAERIKQLRADRGNPPQPVVAAAIGVSLRALQKYEAGDAIPRYHNLGRLAEYYGVTESYILEGVDNRPEVQGVPEQLETVDAKFTELVEAVAEQLEQIETKLDRLMRMVDAGLFIPPTEVAADDARRHSATLREDQHGLGEALAAAFQASPQALEALARQLQPAPTPAQRTAAKRSRRAS